MRHSEDSPAGEARLYRDWTQGSVIRNLISLSWPVLVSQVLNMIGPTIDMIWVGKLGSSAVAGVGIAGLAVTVSNAAMRGLTMGMRALIARFAGAGDYESANNVSRQAFVICVGYSIVIAAIGMFLADPILTAFGVEADVVAEGAAYMRIMFVGSIAMSLRQMTESCMQASGDAVMPMRIAVMYRVIHAALAPFLIFGWWLFPRLGVQGAAATNIISQSLGLIAGLWILLGGRTRLRLSVRGFRLDSGIIWRMVKVGIPSAIMHIQHHFAILILVWFITPFGTMAVAGHAIWQRVDTIVMTTATGLGVGAGVLGGQNLGAGQPERAVRSGWLAIGFAQVFMLIVSAVIVVWAENVVRIFNTEPALVEITSDFLRIAAVGNLALGFNMVFMQFLTAVGDTMMAMLGELLQTWMVQIPLAFILSKYTGLGVYGVRWAMASGIIVGGIIFTLYFWRGRWKRKKI